MIMQNENPRRWLLRWAAANSAGYIIGWSLFGLIGHGLTGNHDDALSLPQFIAHTAGLLVAAAVIATAHQTVFRRLGLTNRWSVWATVAILPAAFWTGYYAAGIPFDILLAFTTIGIIGGLAWRQVGKGWAWVNGLSFPAGFGVTAALTYPVSDALLGSFGGGLAGHVCLFTYIGVVGGVSSGLFTALAMAALDRQSRHKGAWNA